MYFNIQQYWIRSRKNDNQVTHSSCLLLRNVELRPKIRPDINWVRDNETQCKTQSKCLRYVKSYCLCSHRPAKTLAKNPGHNYQKTWNHTGNKIKALHHLELLYQRKHAEIISCAKLPLFIDIHWHYLCPLKLLKVVRDTF